MSYTLFLPAVDVYEYRLHQVMEPVPPEHIDQEKNLQEEVPA